MDYTQVRAYVKVLHIGGTLIALAIAKDNKVVLINCFMHEYHDIELFHWDNKYYRTGH